MAESTKVSQKVFKAVEEAIQDVLNGMKDKHVYIEEDNRGTYPTLVIRVLPQKRQRAPRRGAKILSSPTIVVVQQSQPQNQG